MGKVRRRAPKRAKQERQYSKDRTDFIKEQDKPYCFFCGKEVTNPDLHHLDGRDGDRLLDKSKWVLAHHECHLNYHSMAWDKLPWWCDYLKRLRKYPDIFQKELIKMSKM